MDRVTRAVDFMFDHFLVSVVGVTLFILVGIGFACYDQLQKEAKLDAWVTACENKGGNPVPKSYWHDKGGAHYSHYVCAKLEILQVE
jgi:hypothetical protein